MLTQEDVNMLLELLKSIKDPPSIFEFPLSNEYKKIDVLSQDLKHRFLVDINRKGKINAIKCTYQSRYRKDEILLRLDINGPPHTNPDGQVVSGNHMHIYQEGFGASWAYELPSENFPSADLLQCFIDFLEYFKVTNYSDMEVQQQIEEVR